MTPLVITLIASISLLTSLGLLILAIRLIKSAAESRNPGCSVAVSLPVIALNLLLALYFWGMTLDAQSGDPQMLQGYIEYIWAAPAAMATITAMIICFMVLRFITGRSR